MLNYYRRIKQQYITSRAILLGCLIRFENGKQIIAHHVKEGNPLLVNTVEN